MRVHTIRIPCRDLAPAEAFYSKLLGRGKAFGDPAGEYVGFALDNASLLLEPAEAGEFETGRYLGFSIEVGDIHEFYRRLRDELLFSGPPKSQPWGGTMTHVTDTSGNTLSIVQIDPAPRADP